MNRALLMLLVLVGVAFACEKFDKNVDMFCKFNNEPHPCIHDNIDSVRSSCCSQKGGCNSSEFPKDKVCCFTQECLDRCYPGKHYKIGTVH